MYFIDKIKAMLLLSVPKCMHGQVQLHLQPLSPQSNILCMYCTKSTGGCCYPRTVKYGAMHHVLMLSFPLTVSQLTQVISYWTSILNICIKMYPGLGKKYVYLCSKRDSKWNKFNFSLIENHYSVQCEKSMGNWGHTFWRANLLQGLTIWQVVYKNHP